MDKLEVMYFRVKEGIIHQITREYLERERDLFIFRSVFMLQIFMVLRICLNVFTRKIEKKEEHKSEWYSVSLSQVVKEK